MMQNHTFVVIQGAVIPCLPQPYLFNGSRGESVSRHIDDIITPCHDVHIAITVLVASIHSVIIPLQSETQSLYSQKHSHSTVRNIVPLQSETQFPISQKYGHSTVRNIVPLQSETYYPYSQKNKTPTVKNIVPIQSETQYPYSQKQSHSTVRNIVNLQSET